MLQVGRLNKRITLQSPVNTADGMGGITLTWTDETDLWAAIWPTSANEVLRNEAPLMTITHRIRIRYYGGIQSSWRVKYGTRYFNIVSVINPNEKNEMIDLLAKEAA